MFCLSRTGVVTETILASAEDRALRGRNPSAVGSLTDGRFGGGFPPPGRPSCRSQIQSEKIHLPATLRAMKNFNSLTVLPHH